MTDESEQARRALWHDVRSVLGAVSANVEYVAGTELTEAARGAVREIELEVRLVADVIEILSARRDPAKTLELDLRALLWVSRRSGARIAVDATMTPFMLRGPFQRIQELHELVVRAAERTGTEASFGSTGIRCTIGPLDPAAVRSIVAAPFLATIGVAATGEDGMLVLSLTTP